VKAARNMIETLPEVMPFLLGHVQFPELLGISSVAEGEFHLNRSLVPDNLLLGLDIQSYRRRPHPASNKEGPYQSEQDKDHCSCTASYAYRESVYESRGDENTGTDQQSQQDEYDLERC